VRPVRARGRAGSPSGEQRRRPANAGQRYPAEILTPDEVRALIKACSNRALRAGARVIQIGHEPDAPWVTSRSPRQAHLEGFDLHADITVAADDRTGLERLCRYVLRPPVAQDRLALAPEGQVLLTLKAEWADGTTHLLFAGPCPARARSLLFTARSPCRGQHLPQTGSRGGRHFLDGVFEIDRHSINLGPFFAILEVRCSY
jgi:hypothetical protein